MLKNNKLFKIILSVTSLIVLAKILGLVKQIIVASIYGTTFETDLINLAQGFVGDIQYIITQTILAAFVTIYIRKKQKNNDEASIFSSQTLALLVFFTLFLSVIFFLLSGPIAKFLAPSYDEELLMKLSFYIKCYSPFLLAFAFISSFHAVLNANEKFVPGQIESLTQSIVVIVFVLLFGKKVGAIGIFYSFCIYTIFNVIFLGVLAIRHYKVVKIKELFSSDLKELMKIMWPLLISYSMLYINQLVDKILVSGLGEGSISSLNYAAVLANLVGTIITTITSVFFTYITQDISNENTNGAIIRIKKITIGMTLIFLPVSIISIICAKDIVSIIYEHGEFNGDSVLTTSDALRGYGFFFFPMVFRELYSRIHYAFKDSKTPMVSSVIGIAINIALSIVLSKIIGVFGVALATSISVFVSGILNYITVRYKRIEIILFEKKSDLLLVFLSSIMCCFICVLSMHILSNIIPLLRFIIVCIMCVLACIIIDYPIYKKVFIRRKNNG